MFAMFALTSQFNKPIGKWDVAKVTDMSFVFYASSFNQNISTWDVSSVTNMNDMFESSPFNQNISTWDVSSVTDMSFMFEDSPFNQPIADWNVSSVTFMSYMFAFTPFNQNISSWNVSSVTRMQYMFYFNSAFSQDITGWTTNTMEFDKVDYKDMFFRAESWLDAYEYTVVSEVCNQEAPYGPPEYWSVIPPPPPSPCPGCLIDGGKSFTGTMFWAMSTWCDIGPAEWDASDFATTYGSIENWNTTFVTDMSEVRENGQNKGGAATMT